MSLSDFQILQKLGDGSYSSVYKVKRVEDGLEYALKKVKISHLSDREKENALNEVRILASIKHNNVASYKQAFFDEPSSSLCIVMEYADNGDVFQKICQYQQQGNLFKEKVVWKIFIQTVRGLKALHDLKILHRDMKSANIFLFRDYTAKLGDLNVSKVAKKGLLYTQTGTPYYASPEVWKDQPYDCKSDIWSLGCVLYEMCSLVPPFRADDMNGLFKRVLKGAYPQIPTSYSMDLRNIIKSLLQVNAAQRPTTEQILDMPIIVRRIKKYFKDETMNNSVMTANGQMGDAESELLKTIKFSKNLFKLKLPPPTYDSIQFQTLPSQPFSIIQPAGGMKSNVSRNQGNGVNHTMPTAPSEKTTTTSLPKIQSSSRNYNNGVNGLSLQSQSHSTKSQVRGALNISLSQEGGVGEEMQHNEEDNYDQEMFEQQHDDKQLPQIPSQGVPLPHYMQPKQQQHSNSKVSKSRSYSGRNGPVNIEVQQVKDKISKIKAAQQHQLENNDYNDQSAATYTLNTGRSKSTVSYINDDTPQHKNLLMKGGDHYRGLNQSPSQQNLSQQENVNSQNLSQSKNSKPSQINITNLPHQPTPIDEKVELESQYQDDFEVPPPVIIAQNRAQKVIPGSKSKLIAAGQIKSGKRSQNVLSGPEQSVTTSIQGNQISQALEQSLIERKAARDNSHGSNKNGQTSNTNQADISMVSNQSNIYNTRHQREERKGASPHYIIGQKNNLSRSPSDQSLEKTTVGEGSIPPRSLQPSQLGKNLILKPQPIPASQQSQVQINQSVLSQNNAALNNISLTQSAVKKTQNIDRIVNIYSINSNKAKKKKFYLNMATASNAGAALGNHQSQLPSAHQQQATKDVSPSPNEDIRVKLKQLREGIGYYEAKSSQNRNYYHHNGAMHQASSVDQNNSFETNPSQRNNNNSSVLLPELRGSLSPGQHYHSNNSIMGKKQSLDRILRGIPQNDNSHNINRIYRKVFATNQHGDAISRVSGISSELTGGSLRSQHAVPLKVRPANINIHRVNSQMNNIVNSNLSSAHLNNNGGSENNGKNLDIQGKSVIHNYSKS